MVNSVIKSPRGTPGEARQNQFMKTVSLTVGRILLGGGGGVSLFLFRLNFATLGT